MTENALAVSIAKQITESSWTGWYMDAGGVTHTVKCIPFRQYMSCCLYDAEYGYYRSGPVRIGKKGDFYTSSGIGRVLAEVIAGYSLQYGRAIGKPLRLIEWGAGTGRLSAQIAAAGQTLSDHWEERFISILIEDHPSHALASREAFAALKGTIHAQPLLATSDEAWEADWLRQPALVLANELLDAFPVHRVQCVNGQLAELGVAGTAEHGFHDVYMPLTDPRISGWLVRDGIQLKEGQQTEVHAGAADFLKRLGSTMTEGRLLLIDYGHESAEYTAEHRMLGTLMCYWQHQASDSPFVRIGEQDITSHVPFTFIRHSAEESGWQVSSYSTQKQFLIDNGVFELLQNHNSTDPFSEMARMNRAIRQLLLSDQMSETFKVMVLDKR
ncbi:class I SAM-dependent methyltransferase [Paenibacillus prosopidis]|uniref:SAM-dependent MidA family methyltransferase n=1 Tax=Paenibacillus prosopidis TaxID=630520 RepID=A0A368VWJ0_9BACL|nr:SAM-dependent methyltransferase [Paenibacillus prosopidis]RCW46521.1 SAM-dependent MidA family methyltransferase [Paenibacillus prosopidis]